MDFRFGRAKAAKVVAVRWVGPWNEARIKRELEGVGRWAKAHKLRTGRWFFQQPRERTWEVAVEVFGRARPEGRMTRRTYKASAVAEVRFDPEQVSPRVVYHGLTDWLRWRRKEGTIRRAGIYREVYEDNPWKNPKAWHDTLVQVVVHKD